jgi:tungstate transport system substrate-binding protein
MRMCATVALFCLALHLSAAGPAAGQAAQGTLHAAAVRSLAWGGFLDHISEAVKADAGISIDWSIADADGIFPLGARCAADVLFADAPEAEERFVAEGRGALRFRVMYSDLVLAGPREDPAEVKGMAPAAAFSRIASRGAPFVSDRSAGAAGREESSLWVEARRRVPDGEPWYLTCGGGSMEALAFAARIGAYTLAARRSLVACQNGGQGQPPLEMLIEDDPSLRHQYSIIAVNSDACEASSLDLAVRFILWLVSPRGQARIADFGAGGAAVYFPNAGTDTCSTCR